MLLSALLKQRRASIADEAATKSQKAQAIYAAAQAAKRQPTAEEISQFDALMAEVETASVEIKKLDTQITAQEAIENAARPTPAIPSPSPVQDPAQGTGIYRPLAIVHDRWRTLASTPTAMLTTEERRERAYRAGMWARGVIYDDPRAREWCNSYGVRIQNVMTEGVNGSGGALVPEEFEAMIIDNREQFGVARRFCRVVPMTRETKTMPKRTSGLTVYYPGENPGSDYTASDKGWANVGLTARIAAVLTKFSGVLEEDAVISIVTDLSQEIGYAFGEAEDNALFNGDGSQTYGGIVGLRTTFVNGLGGATELLGAFDAASGHDTMAEIDSTDLSGVMATLPEYARSVAAWYCSSVFKALVFDRIAQSASGNTMINVGNGPEQAYMGYPIRISQKMPTAITDISDTVMCFFGDMRRAALFGDRRGITIQILRELYAAQGLVGLIGSERFDIKTADVGTTTVAGPLVALVAE